MKQDLITEEKVLDELKKAVEETLSVDEASIKPGSSLINDLGAESLDFLDINYRLEQTFGIKMARHFILEHIEEMFGESFTPGNGIFHKVPFLFINGVIPPGRKILILKEILLPFIGHLRQPVDLGLELQFSRLLSITIRVRAGINGFALLIRVFQKRVLNHLVPDDYTQFLQRHLKEIDSLLHLRREDHPLVHPGNLLDCQRHKLAHFVRYFSLEKRPGEII